MRQRGGGEGKCVLHAAERQCELYNEELVSVCLMKGNADNPHDENLGAEIVEGCRGRFSLN